MGYILILSQPVFEESQFEGFTKKILTAESKVFIVNYANEPIMLMKRFKRNNTPEITEKYMQELRDKLQKFKINENAIFYSEDNDTYEDFMYKYNQCDVLIFCGGAPENLLDKIEKIGVADIIRSTTKSLICYSAGAEILLEYLVLLPSSFWPGSGDYYKKIDKRPAINRVKNLSLAFHYTVDKDDWMNTISSFVGRDLYALSDADGLFIDGEEYFWIGNPKKFIQV